MASIVIYVVTLGVEGDDRTDLRLEFSQLGLDAEPVLQHIPDGAKGVVSEAAHLELKYHEGSKKLCPGW